MRLASGTNRSQKKRQEYFGDWWGAGGTQCPRTLGERGYQVALLEERHEFGGRVVLKSALPGLIEWRRVIDWRLNQIEKLNNVSLYPGSPMAAEDVLEVGYANVMLATGAKWRKDGVGRKQWKPIEGHDLPHGFTPDDLMAGVSLSGQVLIFDDDHYYMGSVLAELLLQQGCHVTIATPAPLIAYWSQFTLEQEFIQRRLMNLEVRLYPQYLLQAIREGCARLLHTVTGAELDLEAEAVILVTDRLPNDGLYKALRPAIAAGKLNSLRVIGDAEAPHIIAQAVFAGHLAGGNLTKFNLKAHHFELNGLILFCGQMILNMPQPG